MMTHASRKQELNTNFTFFFYIFNSYIREKLLFAYQKNDNLVDIKCLLFLVRLCKTNCWQNIPGPYIYACASFVIYRNQNSNINTLWSHWRCIESFVKTWLHSTKQWNWRVLIFLICTWKQTSPFRQLEWNLQLSLASEQLVRIHKVVARKNL